LKIRSTARRVRGRLWLGVASGGLAVSGVATSARAVQIDWDNGAGADKNYNTPANWAGDVVPPGGDDATFINPALGPVVINADIPTPRDFRFGDNEANVQRPGSITVNHTAGAASINGWFRMGLGGTGSGGEYNLSGGSFTAGRFNVAETGGSTGTVTVSGGTLTQRDVGDIANADNWNRIGQDGSATFNVSGGGTVSLDARTLIGAGGSSNSTVTQTGGTFETRRGEIVIGDGGTAVYNISAGTLRAQGAADNDDSGGNITVGQWDNSNGTLNVSGTANVSTVRDLNVGNGRLQTDPPNPVPTPSTGTVTQSGGTVTVGRDLNIANGNTSQVGSYTLSGGTLDMTGGTIRKGADDTFVVSGTGRLINVGTIDFPFAQGGGTFNPGPQAGPGATTVNGGYNQAAAGTLQVDITAPSGTDLLNVTGAVSLAGNLDIVATGGLLADQSFLILQNDGADAITGAFLGKAQGVPFLEDGTLWRISYTGGDGNDVALTVVPEPATLGLAALGACGLLLRRRRAWR
jgi:PEP-CTERM motif-containing protein